MIISRGPEVWKHHPYLGLLLCLAVGGGFWYGVYESLVQGSYRWGRGNGATIITRVHDPVAFWLGTLALALPVQESGESAGDRTGRLCVLTKC